MAEEEGDPFAAIGPILNDIKSSNERLREISSYCQSNFSTNKAEVYQRTQQYAQDALLNAAYHIHRGAESISNFLNDQLFQLDEITQSVATISVKFDGIREDKKKIFDGDMPRTEPGSKVVTEEGTSCSRQNNRTTIDLTLLDNVGISLSDEQN